MIKKVENSPAISEKNIFNALLESLEYGLTIQDRDYNILFQNNFMRINFGSASGKCYKDYEFRDTPCDECPVREAFKDEKSHDTERTVHEPTGESRVWLNTAIPIRNDKGKVVACLEIVRDISPQKRMEKSIIENESRLRTLCHTIPDLIWLKNESGVYLTCNKMFERFFGAKEEEIVGKTDYDFVDKDLADFFRENDRRTMTAGKSSHNEEWITFADDGHRALLDTIKTPMLDSDGNLVGVLGVGRDITERSKLEAMLSQTQKMEAMGNLAGGIAHDFNNILSAIMGYAELVEERLPPDSIEKEMQGQIVKATILAKDLVKQILLFSRQSEIEMKPVCLRLIVKEAMKLLRSSIPTTIEIKHNISKDTGMVLADTTQIHQIVMNLCTNAYHAMRETGGTLSISLTEREILKEDLAYSDLSLTPGTYLLLEISDTGHGMSKTTINQIFDPYFTTKEMGEGTGLGLAVVHGIVKTCGGDIRVYSEPGQGASFHVYFPKIEEKSQGDVNREHVALQRGDERILLVDDEPMGIKMLEKSLTNLGYQVSAFTKSQEALDSFIRTPGRFDLVVTDMTMPKMTGMELSKRILSIRPEIRIVLCTGYSELISKEKAEAIGIKALLLKPVLREELAKTIRETLDAEHLKA